MKPKPRVTSTNRVPEQVGAKAYKALFAGSKLHRSLNENGFALIPGLLSSAQCAGLIDLYDRADLFRSRINMTRHGFGRGEYRYFDYPLPDTVDALRNSAYAGLARVAQEWAEKLRQEAAYPGELSEFLGVCAAAGQSRATPLILKYGRGDYNRLHQDIYGEIGFPLQLAVFLNQAGRDFEGGEFVLTEQRARMQSRVHVIRGDQGDGIVFANRYRPVESRRGYSRANVRHGVSTLRAGHRYCLGVIFHDAA